MKNKTAGDLSRVLPALGNADFSYLVLPALVDADDLEPLGQPIFLVGHPPALRPRPCLRREMVEYVRR